jgi:uncharacterized protein YecE (DUF72 family)
MSKFRIGTSGWTYEHWKGSFYPDKLPKSHWFEYYTTLFDAVEINATFYGTFKDQTYHSWYNRSPEGFKFVLKAPRLITHRKYLVDCDELIKTFWRSASLLEDKLGLILLQIAPDMPFDLPLLKQSIQAFGNPSQIAVEFRHNQWNNDETKNMLQNIGAVYCNADSPRSQLNDWLTSDNAYLRLHGRKRWYSYDYSEEELQEIAGLAHRLTDKGARTVFIFFNNDFESYAPKNALRLKETLAA